MAKAKKAKKTAAKKKSAAKKPGKAPDALAGSAEQKAARLPSGDSVRALERAMKANQGTLDDIAVARSTAMREAVDRRGLHKRAFKSAMALKKLAEKDPAAAGRELQHFDHYVVEMGIEKLVSAEPELPVDLDGQAKAAGGAAAKEAAKPSASKAQRSNGGGEKDTSVALEDGTKLRPNFTDPAAEQQIAEQSKSLN